MNLAIDHEERDGAVVIEVTGEIDLQSVGMLEAGMSEAAGAHPLVVVDLRPVTYIDSSGLACLHRLHLACRDRAATMRVVVGERSTSKRLLSLTGLDEVIETASTVEAALGASGH
jgi:anti-sigma B factor antagonist